MLHRDAIQAARETLVILRRQARDIDRQIAATETFIESMTGRAPGEAHKPVSRSRIHRVPVAHSKAVLEALSGTEESREGMPRTEIAELTGIDTGSLSRCIGLLTEQGRIVQTNPAARRNTRFKLRGEVDSSVIKIRAGVGEIGRSS
jgi:hypothetical protein